MRGKVSKLTATKASGIFLRLGLISKFKTLEIASRSLGSHLHNPRYYNLLLSNSRINTLHQQLLLIKSIESRGSQSVVSFLYNIGIVTMTVFAVPEMIRQ
jgi:hypothetical protein